MRYWMLGALLATSVPGLVMGLTIDADLPINNSGVIYSPQELYQNEPAAVPVDVQALPDYFGIDSADVENYFAEEFDSAHSAARISPDLSTFNAYFELYDSSRGYVLVTRNINGGLDMRAASNDFNKSTRDADKLPADSDKKFSQMFSLNGVFYAFSQGEQQLYVLQNASWVVASFTLPAAVNVIRQKNNQLYAFVNSGSDAGIWKLQTGAAQQVSALADQENYQWGQEAAGPVIYGLKLGVLSRDDLSDNQAAIVLASEVQSFWPGASGILLQRTTSEGASFHWYELSNGELSLVPSDLQSGAVRMLPSCSNGFGVVSCLARGNDSKWYSASVSVDGVVLDSVWQSAALQESSARVYGITAIGSNRILAAGTSSSLQLQKVLPGEGLLTEFNPKGLSLGKINSVSSFRSDDSSQFYTLIRTEQYIMLVSFIVQGDLSLRPVPVTMPAARDYLVFPAEDKKASSISPIGLGLALLLLLWRSRRVFKEK